MRCCCSVSDQEIRHEKFPLAGTTGWLDELLLLLLLHRSWAPKFLKCNTVKYTKFALTPLSCIQFSILLAPSSSLVVHLNAKTFVPQ